MANMEKLKNLRRRFAVVGKKMYLRTAYLFYPLYSYKHRALHSGGAFEHQGRRNRIVQNRG